MKKLVVKKGYTVEVTSWENDGDNYRTKSKTYDKKEEALLIKRLCTKLFNSCHGHESGIGNIMDDEADQAKPLIVEYIVQNPAILNFSNNIKSPVDLEDEIKGAFPEENIGKDWLDYIHDYIEVKNEKLGDDWIDFIMDYNYTLLGSSEYYYSRIVEKVSIYYSDKDVYLEEIE